MNPVPKPSRQKCPRCGKRPRDAYALLVHVHRCRAGKPDRMGRTGAKEKRHGYTWDSALERHLYEQLLLRGRAGEFRCIFVKPCIRLTLAGIRYRPDFAAPDMDDRLEYFEAKGFETERWLIVKQLWPFYGPGPLHIYVEGHQGEPRFLKTLKGGECP